MRVILKQDVPKLGEAGETKTVADGYARNYLIPRKLAVEATEGEAKHIKDMQKVKKSHKQKEKQSSRQKLEKLMKEFFVIKVKAGEKGKLFGSVTNKDIAEKLSQYLGEKVSKKFVQVDGPLKEVGTYDVKLKLPGGVKGTLKLKLEKEEE